MKYFGRFAVDIGKFSEEIDVPEGTTVGELVEILKKKYPQLEREIIEVSVGGRYAREEDRIGEEVAIYPPISGG